MIDWLKRQSLGVYISISLHIILVLCLFFTSSNKTFKLPKPSEYTIKIKSSPQATPSKQPAKEAKKEVAKEVIKEVKKEPIKPIPKKTEPKIIEVEPPKPQPKPQPKPVPQPTQKPMQKQAKPKDVSDIENIIKQNSTKEKPVKKSLQEELIDDIGGIVGKKQSKKSINDALSDFSDDSEGTEVKDIAVAEAILTLKKQIDRCWQKVLYESFYGNKESIVNFKITYSRDGVLQSFQPVIRQTSTQFSEDYQKLTEDAKRAINLCKTLEIKPNPRYHYYWKTLEYKFSTNID
jgi:hypothetical protein